MTPGRELLRAAKASASSHRPTLCLPVGQPVTGLLRPVVTRPGAIPADDVRALTEWRNRFVNSFLTEFVATEEHTERWLVETVGPDETRILFMVEDLDGRTVGYLGLAFIDWDAESAELDHFVRGADAPAGLMSGAREAIWSWGRNALGLTKLSVRARSDNSVVEYYTTKAGGRELRRVPLRREETPNGIRWVEDPSLTNHELAVVHIELESDDG